MEDWAEIRRLHRTEGLPIKMIARTLGVSRNTVRAALASEGPPKYVRKPTGSAVDAFEPRIREQLQAFPTMPATVIAERVGWTRGMTVFKERVRELRPAYLPPDPASRTTYEAGELAQFDFWFPDIEIPVGYGQTRTAKRLPVMTTVTGYSRWSGGLLIPSRDARDLYAAGGGCCPSSCSVCRRRWCGTAKRGGPVACPPTRAHRRLPGVPRRAGREGGDLQAR